MRTTKECFSALKVKEVLCYGNKHSFGEWHNDGNFGRMMGCLAFHGEAR